MLAPHRVGDPASARAFARPYRDVVGRMARWEQRRSPRRTTRSPPSTSTSTPPAGSPSGAWSGRSISPTGPPAQRTEWSFRTRASIPPRPLSWASGWRRWGSTPRRSCWSTAAPPPSAPSSGGSLAGAPDHEFTDRAEQRNRVWAIRDADGQADSAEAAGRLPRPDRRRAPPVRGLPAHAGDPPGHRGRPRAGHAGRPGRHAAVPRRDPPGPGRARRSTALQKAAAGHGVVHGPQFRRRCRRARPGHPRGHRRHDLGDLRLYLADGRAAVEVLHEALLPALPTPPARVGYHHSVDDTLAQPPRRRGRGRAHAGDRTTTSSAGSWPTTACSRRRPPPSSPSRAWACSCARCATDDLAAGRPPPRPATRCRVRS